MNEKTVGICPRCQQRFTRSPGTGDFVHTCFGVEALKNEDVLVIGAWQDYTGSDSTIVNLHLKAQENSLQGTRADIEGVKIPGKWTSRGFPVNQYRTRQHLEYIDGAEFKNTETSDTFPEEYDGDH